MVLGISSMVKQAGTSTCKEIASPSRSAIPVAELHTCIFAVAWDVTLAFIRLFNPVPGSRFPKSKLAPDKISNAVVGDGISVTIMFSKV